VKRMELCTEVEKVGVALVGEARLIFVSLGKMHDLNSKLVKYPQESKIKSKRLA